MKIYPQTFYKTAQLEAPYNLSHRQIRIMQVDPTTKKEMFIDLFGCRDIEYLRKKLIYFAPSKAYISASCYLNPEVVSLKLKQKPKTYRYLPNILLSSDFVMDFDDGAVNSLLQLLRAYDFLREKGYKEFKAVQTKRGFHLWILDWYAKECQNNVFDKPFAREKFIFSKKCELCAELESQNIEFDKPISIDTRRIFKLWGSLTDDYVICRTWNDPEALAKEFMKSKTYLPNITENQAKAKRILPDEGSLDIGS